MPEIESFDAAALALICVAPGLVVLYFRSKLLTGQFAKGNDFIFNYFVISATYYAVAYPLIWLAHTIRGNDFTYAIGLFALLAIGPAIFGIILGYIDAEGLVQKFLRKFNLRWVHSHPTAWDYKFSRLNGSFVLITLTDDTRFAGWCGPNSFISSDSSERDIYVEKVYILDSANKWTDDGDRSVLLRADQIRSIEFLPPKPQGSTP